MTELTETMKALTEKLRAPRPQLTTDPKQYRPVGASFRYPPTVTPYLPQDAIIAAQAHERTGHPAFVKAFERSSSPLACPNCQGVGMIVLNLAEAGPFKSPPGAGKVITWFDGNEKYRAGWYIVEKTLAFYCPECMKK